MVKSALVVCQGVASSQGYLYNLVKDNPYFTKQYQKIVDVPTDEIFTKKKPWYIKLWGKFGNKLDDMVDVLYHTKERIEACRMTRNIIKAQELDGYSVDILAHSLGCLITLTSGPNSPVNPIVIDTLYLTGCPLGVKNLLMRMKTNRYVERFGNNFTARKIHYLYSEDDFVSGVLKGRVFDILEARSMESPSLHHTNTSHDAAEYVDFLIERGL